MRLALLVVALGMLSCNSSRIASDSSGNWTTLFDGQSTKGWHSYGKQTAGKAWKVENGVLFLDAASKKQGLDGGDLTTDEEYENFHLKLDWRISTKGNSGIIFFINEDQQYTAPYYTGPEYQLIDNGSPTGAGHADARIYTHRAGDLYDLLASAQVANPTGEWNTSEIIARNGKLDFYMNGKHTLSTTMWDENWNKMVGISKFKDMKGFGKYTRGRIALQDHGDNVYFRKISIRRL